ncbi:MAG: hypothetical protein K6F63_10165 [Lachnospiraceae bacterium]|nr:hypothetical protein [Lachnospiraceae bacterium]
MKRKIIFVLCLLLCVSAGCGNEKNAQPLTVTATPTPKPTAAMTPVPTPISEEEKAANAALDRLSGYMNLVRNYNLEPYANPEVVLDALKEAEALSEKKGTVEEYDAMLEKLKQSLTKLNDGSGLVPASLLPSFTEYPDAFTFADGSAVDVNKDWEERLEEISKLYQYYVYGVYRDGEGEKLTFDAQKNKAVITVENNGKKGSFNITVSVPDETKVQKPENGWPYIIALGWFQQTVYANDRGYAVITFMPTDLASDDSLRKGIFYDIYPYGKKWEDQTGALLAWGWGFSKVIDALEQGMGEVYGIDPEVSIITGVSRYGKATAVAGAFDRRIKVSVPTCSGAGGMAMFRYISEGQIYDLSSVGGSSDYKFGKNEPLSSLQSGSEGHWFNDNFKKITKAEKLPVDQNLLAAMYAGQDRYLFITSSYLHEDWTNPPAMWEAYKESKKIFTALGEPENVVFNIHPDGHMVTDADVVRFIDFTEHYVYGKEVETDFNDLTTCLFADGPKE